MRLVCGFAQLGWRVSLIAPQSGPVPDMPGGAAYFPIEPVAGYLNRLRRAGRVLPLLRQLKPDVVLFPDPDLMSTLVRYKRESQATVIFDRHENYEIYWRFRSASLTNAVLGRAYAMYECYAVRRLSGVVVVLDEMRQAIPAGVPVCVAHNYPSRVALQALAAPPAAGTPSYTSVFIGSIERAYGHQRLLEVAHELVNVRGLGEFTLYLAGPFEAGLADEVQRYIEEQRLERNVTLKPGRVPYARAIDLVAASQIGLCPQSRQVCRQNSLPTKLLEFMAAGLPVIASESGLAGRIVKAAGCGKLFLAEEVQQIADTVAHWMQHPEEAGALGKSGQQYVLQHLVWDDELNRLADWIEQLRREQSH
jgi:glycosyltransferase involved in cell wall biosynthesis